MESSLRRNVWDGVGQETQAAGKGRFHCINGKDPGVGRTPPEFQMKKLLIRINKKEEGKMCVISEWVKCTGKKVNKIENFFHFSADSTGYYQLVNARQMIRLGCG